MEKILTDGKFNLAAFPFCGGKVTFAINSNFVVCGLKLKRFWVNVVSLCFSRSFLPVLPLPFLWELLGSGEFY